MIIKTPLYVLILLLCAQSLCAVSLQEQFNHYGYAEIYDENNTRATYDSLYTSFDELITFLQAHPAWVQKLYIAKERFIRSEHRHYYSTDFFGFYDDSARGAASQIYFYYSTHFHDFLFLHYPEFACIPQITTFFASCCAMQKVSQQIFKQAAIELNVETVFSPLHEQPPVLLKVVKYLPSYNASRPHYDGSAFSLFLDSTDDQSLLLSPYKSTLTVDDFFCPMRAFNQGSMLLIPGSFLTEFFIHPTPHIVTHSGNIRYATVAFAMRPHYTFLPYNFSLLPQFKH